jgi:molybdate transport system substrate-binding protein
VFRGTAFFAIVLLAAVCCQGQTSGSLRIAAAADLQPVLPALISEFEARDHQNVEAVYGSSATLAAQILNGAPFGLFLSADLSFPQKVVDAGLSVGNAPVPYAKGTLVLWARNDSPGQPVGLDSLKRPAVRTVAVANPEHAPYGRAARSAIEKLGLAEVLKDKLVVAENIAQTAQFADSGNANAGFISLTSALTPRLRTDGKYVEVPADSYSPIVQGAVVIKGSEAEAGERFLQFLQSAPIRQKLAQGGLRAP